VSNIFNARVLVHPSFVEPDLIITTAQPSGFMDVLGGRSLRVNNAMRNGAGANAGDTVKLAILGPEPPPKPPADLRAALTAARGAKTLWREITWTFSRLPARTFWRR
jgi:hypothetical protein